MMPGRHFTAQSRHVRAPSMPDARGSLTGDNSLIGFEPRANDRRQEEGGREKAPGKTRAPASARSGLRAWTATGRPRSSPSASSMSGRLGSTGWP